MSGFTGFGYDIASIVMFIIQHIEEYTNTHALAYAEREEKPQRPLINVSNPAWEIIAVGFHAEPCAVHMPCLMVNKTTGEWGWSRDILWFDGKQGFVWSGGNYRPEEYARREFNEYATGVVWHTEDY